ncbi:uncharacterized protein LOC101234739 isoform X2 [Hydra vulgaris]|uniref:Uncharacterized protein LOC101234739 isoform X2 n=1 Tax=Hydra vulgaris TaxID=6087 RepID=A0ABM4BHM1_HYDVU
MAKGTPSMKRQCWLVLIFLNLNVVANKDKHHLKKQKRDSVATLPDKISSLMTDEIKTGTQFESLGCIFEVAKDDCKTTFLPKQSSCQGMTVPKFFQYFYRESNIKNLTYDFIPMRILQVDRFIMDQCLGEVDIESTAKEGFQIIKGKMKLFDGKVLTTFYYKEVSGLPDFEKFSIEISGNVIIGKHIAPISLIKKKNSLEAQISIRLTSMTALDFYQSLTNKALLDKRSLIDTHIFSDANMQDPLLTGYIGVNGDFEIVLKGEIQHAVLGAIFLSVVVQKPVDSATGVALVASINNIKPNLVLSIATGRSLETFPIMKGVVSDLVLEFSNEDLYNIRDDNVNMVLDKYISGDKNISKGAKIKLHLPSDKIIQRVKEPNKILVQIYLIDGSFSLKFPDKLLFDLASVTNNLIPKVPVALFSKVFQVSPEVLITKFIFDIMTKDINVKCLAPEELIMGKDLMAVKNAEFEITHKRNESWKFEMHARKKIAGTYMDVSLEKKKDHYLFLGKIDKITTKQLATNFGAKQVGEATIGQIEFLNYDLLDVRVDADFNEDMKLHFVGNPLFFNYNSSKFEGYVLDVNGARKMIFGLVLNDFRMDDFIQRCYQKDLNQVKWISKLSATLMISNTDDMKGITFVTPEFKNKVSLRKGVTFSSLIPIPESCHGERICEFAKEKVIPGTKLSIDGDISKGGLLLRAPYRGNGFEIGKNVVLTQARFLIKVADKSEITIAGIIAIKNPSLIFEALVSMGSTGELIITLHLVDTWKNPFGFSFISFTNVVMTAALHSEVMINKLYMKATMHFGKYVNEINQQRDLVSSEITSDVIISVQPMIHLDDYFYGQIHTINMVDFAKAFYREVVMLKVIKDVKFPDGLKYGYTTNVKSTHINHLNIDLTSGSGLMFYGKLKVLSMNLICFINVTNADVILTANMPPMLIGQDLVYLQRNQDDQENGGKLVITLNNEEFKVEIKTYVELLGVGANVNILIDDKGIKFVLHGKIFNLVMGNVTVFAPLENDNLIASVFQVSSCFLSSVANINAESANIISDVADETAKALKESEERIADSVFFYNQAHAKFVKWTSKLKAYRDAIEKRSLELDYIAELLETPCVMQCKKVCIGGPSINEHWKKMRSRWISSPEWEPCKRKIYDVACLANCKGKQVYKEVEANKKKNIEEVLLNSMSIISQILDNTKLFVEKSKDLINSTVLVAQQVQKVTGAGKEAMEAIANFSKSNIIEIHDICFDMSLQKAVTTYFTLTIDATLGQRKRLNMDVFAKLDAGFEKNIAAAIAEQLFPGIGVIKSDINDALLNFEDVIIKKEDLKAFAKESEIQEQNLEAMIETPEEDNPGEDTPSKNAVFLSEITRDPEYIRKQLYSKTSLLTIRDDLTLDAFEYDSPWSFSQEDSPFTPFKNEEKLETKDNILGSDIYIYPDTPEDPNDPDKCSKTRGLVSNYAIVSQIVNSLLEKLKNLKDHFAAEVKSYIANINQIERNIIHNCKQNKVGDEKTADALFFVYKLRNGTSKWIHNVEQQIATQDRETLRMLRKSFSDVINTDKQMDIQKFLENMKIATTAASKRYAAQAKHAAKTLTSVTFESATKIVEDLLTGVGGTLSSKKSAIDNLHDNVLFLSKQIPCATLSR